MKKKKVMNKMVRIPPSRHAWYIWLVYQLQGSPRRQDGERENET